ncbi:MAG: ABC transporter substrate-binding protein [Bacteroidales bacterium]
MKRISFLFTVILSITVVISTIFYGCDNSKEEVVKIGAILPLTGEGAEWGITSKNAILLALNERNVNNPKIRFEVLFEDSRSTVKDGLSVLNKLDAQNVKFVIGDIISSNVLAMAPVVEKNGILLISPGASNPDITLAGDNVFRTWQSDALEAQVGASFVLDSVFWKKIAIIYLENGYGVGLAKEFEKTIETRGFKPTLVESFKIGQANFRDLISKIKNNKPDGIYLASYPEENHNILKQLKEQQVKIPVLGTQGFVSPQIKTLIPTLNYTIYFSIPLPPDSTSVSVRNFQQNYNKAYGKTPGITADAAYDAFVLLANGIQLHGYNVPKVKNYLYSVKNFSGASGILTINKFGDVEKPFVFIKNMQ